MKLTFNNLSVTETIEYTVPTLELDVDLPEGYDVDGDPQGLVHDALDSAVADARDTSASQWIAVLDRSIEHD